MNSFWHKLQKPFFCSAPLDDVTDAAFRRLIVKYSTYGGRDVDDGSKGNLPVEAFRVGGPDVIFTEFTSADGLAYLHDKTGSVDSPEFKRHPLARKLLFSQEERPIVVQLFTSNPENMEIAARGAAKLGFDGLDINMGCPDRAVEKAGCGAALIKNPALARVLIKAAQSAGLPVSVKTRIGYGSDELDAWLPELLAERPAAITIHARTRDELSDVPARWDSIARAVAIRDEKGSETLIIGNGDVRDADDARVKARESGADGVMIGRAFCGAPWLLSAAEEWSDARRRLAVLLEHTRLFEQLLSDVKSFGVMKKHFSYYVSGFNGAKELRMRLMEAASGRDVERAVAHFLVQRDINSATGRVS